MRFTHESIVSDIARFSATLGVVAGVGLGAASVGLGTASANSSNLSLNSLRLTQSPGVVAGAWRSCELKNFTVRGRRADGSSDPGAVFRGIIGHCRDERDAEVLLAGRVGPQQSQHQSPLATLRAVRTMQNPLTRYASSNTYSPDQWDGWASMGSCYPNQGGAAGGKIGNTGSASVQFTYYQTQADTYGSYTLGPVGGSGRPGDTWITYTTQTAPNIEYTRADLYGSNGNNYTISSAGC